MSEELKFIEEVKKKHIGKWIALKGKEVIAVCNTHEEIFKKLAESKLKEAYVFYSPTKREKEYGFLFQVLG